MAKWLYRLRGSNTSGKNIKTFQCGSAYHYEKALQMAKEIIDNKQYKEVKIERVSIVKILKDPNKEVIDN